MFYLNDIWIFTEDSGQGHVDTYRIVKWPGPKSLIIFPRLQPDGLPPPLTSNLEDLTVFKHWQVSHLPGRLMAAPKVGSWWRWGWRVLVGIENQKGPSFKKSWFLPKSKVQSPKSKKKKKKPGLRDQVFRPPKRSYIILKADYCFIRTKALRGDFLCTVQRLDTGRHPCKGSLVGTSLVRLGVDSHYKKLQPRGSVRL